MAIETPHRSIALDQVTGGLHLTAKAPELTADGTGSSEHAVFVAAVWHGAVQLPKQPRLGVDGLHGCVEDVRNRWRWV